jgi:hypothetical protein
MQTTRRGSWLAVGLCVAGVVLLGATFFGAATWLLLADTDEGDDCAGTEARAAEMAAVGVLHSPPPGVRPTRGWEKPGTGCLDAAEQQLVGSARSYDTRADRETVVRHYRAMALRDGWTESTPSVLKAGDPSEPRTEPEPDACFGRDLPGGPALMRVQFDGPRRFLVSVESRLDGARPEC